MIRISGGDFDFAVRGIEIEGGNDPGVDVQYPWEDAPRRFHRQRLQVKTFYMDRTPVTTFPADAANQPVTWVSIEDARAYAAWAGKRLPHDWEWQYAAQGSDGRLYPWGNDWNDGVTSAPDHGRVMRAPTDVVAFPAGASAFGLLDMAGNISPRTGEFRDQHTRAAVLRGSAFYQPRGSIWLFSPDLPARRTPEVSADVPGTGSCRDDRISLCGGCSVTRPHN
jgi:gamma-glutamyl hercynylcysteine S-oxide synthase